MDMIEGIKLRKSIRAFTDRVPERELVVGCLEAAVWAPNPTSQQPWRFFVLTGVSLARVSSCIADGFAAAQARRPQTLPEISPATAALFERRKSETFSEMMAFLKEHRLDPQVLGLGNFNFHGAPMAVLFGRYPCRDDNFLKSTVAAMQNFMLAATAQGLGTCWCNAVSICQDSIKRTLDLDPDLLLVDGVAVGYPCPGSPLNSLPRRRLPVSDVMDWRD